MRPWPSSRPPCRGSASRASTVEGAGQRRQARGYTYQYADLADISKTVLAAPGPVRCRRSRPSRQRWRTAPSPCTTSWRTHRVRWMRATTCCPPRSVPGRGGGSPSPTPAVLPVCRDRHHPDGEDDDGARAQSAPYSAADAWENAAPASRPPAASTTERPDGPPRRGREARDPAEAELDPDAQPYADEAHEARTLAALKDVNARAREAHKLASLITNPSTKGTGGLGQYIGWRRKQLEDVESALRALNDAASQARMPVTELDMPRQEGHRQGHRGRVGRRTAAGRWGADGGCPAWRSWTDDVIKLLRDWDSSRAAQPAGGGRLVGGRRLPGLALGFRLDGAWASDDPDAWGAMRGTAIHKLLETVLAGEPGFRTEVDTLYRGIPGHADLIVIDEIRRRRLEDDLARQLEALAGRSRPRCGPSASRCTATRPASWTPANCPRLHGAAAGHPRGRHLRWLVGLRGAVRPLDGRRGRWPARVGPRPDGGGGVAAEGQAVRVLPVAGASSSRCAAAQDDRDDPEEITDPELAAAVATYGEANMAASRGREGEEAPRPDDPRPARHGRAAGASRSASPATRGRGSRRRGHGRRSYAAEGIAGPDDHQAQRTRPQLSVTQDQEGGGSDGRAGPGLRRRPQPCRRRAKDRGDQEPDRRRGEDRHGRRAGRWRPRSAPSSSPWRGPTPSRSRGPSQSASTEAAIATMPHREDSRQRGDRVQARRPHREALDRELFAWQSILNSVRAMYGAAGVGRWTGTRPCRGAPRCRPGSHWRPGAHRGQGGHRPSASLPVTPARGGRPAPWCWPVMATPASAAGGPSSARSTPCSTASGAPRAGTTRRATSWPFWATGPPDATLRIDSRIDPHDEAKGYTVRSFDDPALVPVMFFDESGGGFTAWLADDGSLSFDGPGVAAWPHWSRTTRTRASPCTWATAGKYCRSLPAASILVTDPPYASAAATATTGWAKQKWGGNWGTWAWSPWWPRRPERGENERRAWGLLVRRSPQLRRTHPRILPPLPGRPVHRVGTGTCSAWVRTTGSRQESSCTAGRGTLLTSRARPRGTCWGSSPTMRSGTIQHKSPSGWCWNCCPTVRAAWSWIPMRARGPLWLLRATLADALSVWRSRSAIARSSPSACSRPSCRCPPPPGLPNLSRYSVVPHDPLLAVPHPRRPSLGAAGMGQHLPAGPAVHQCRPGHALPAPQRPVPAAALAGMAGTPPLHLTLAEWDSPQTGLHVPLTHPENVDGSDEAAESGDFPLSQRETIF